MVRFSLLLAPLLIISISTISCRPPQSETVNPSAPTEPETIESSSADQPADPPKEFGEGYVELTLDNFQAFSANDTTWKTSGNRIVTTGDKKGYLHTTKSYEDFILTLEYRFEPPADADEKRLQNSNTGVLLYIQEPHKVWPVSLEVQGKFVEIGSIKPNGGAADVVLDDHPDVRESQRNPVGEWNQFEIHSQQGAIKAFLNGELICQSEAGELKAGMIGLQSEGDVVEFRSLAIKSLNADAADSQ